MVGHEVAGGRAMISVICPCCNEADVIDSFMVRLLPTLDGVDDDFEIVFVNDGSRDETVQKLQKYQAENKNIRILDLSRQFGKEAAMSAGIDHAQGDAIIVMDVDLQDPPEVIPDLISEWQRGFEIVVARRKDRQSDSWLKRFFAQSFYRLHNIIGETKIPVDVGDFRLLDRKVVDVLRQMPERQRFMKGLFAWVGFETAVVEFVREKRDSGRSKFSWWRLWNFGLEGITSFSTAPLRVWTYAGSAISGLALAYAAFIVIRTSIYGIDVPGYASIFAGMMFLGGIQLISLGVLGEYIGRIYMESKKRPLYVIRREL